MQIIIDSNVLVAFVWENDPLHVQAMADVTRFSRDTFLTVPATLAEVCHILTNRKARRRFHHLLRQFPVEIFVDIERHHVAQVFAWLERYAEHRPDWADASLVLTSALLPKAKVWTYDREFATVWRRLDGSRIPLAVT